MRKTFYLRDGKKRFWRLCKFIFLGVLIVVGRLVWIQLVHGSDMAELSISQTMGINIVSSPRGAIVDRDGEELAVSIMSKSLYADPVAMEDHPESDAAKSGRNVKRLAADLLAAPLGISAESLYSDFTIEGARFVWIKRTLSPEMAEKVQLIIKKNNLPGLHFLEESKRYYTKGTMAAQVLGFVGTDDVGLSGIELAMDSIIKARSKEMQETTDAVGNPIGESSMEDMRPQNMPTVYLTIDSKIQFVLEDALDRAMKETKSRAAAAILMDPHTGAVLGMASRPTFDPNDFGEYPVSTWTNRAISIIYEPGSVFKPIVGCMGLSENIITPQTVFEDKGSIKIADRVIRNWDGEGRGQVPFEDIIKYSINTGMVQLGMQLGANQMIDYSKKFGFGQPTGIELPGEESGILYRPEDMYEPDIATMAIGQGIAVTPLQMLRAICAIANGGELLEPYIIDKIVMPDGRVLRQGQKKVVRRVITEDVAGQMRMMMEKVVSEGGGKPAHIAGYQIAGKTGTAEKLAEQGGYAPGEYIASFVGFVPAANPQYAMLVMLDTPQGAFYGSQVSAPVFKDTLQQILVAKGIQPSTHEGLPSFEEDAKDKAKAVKVPVMEFLPDNKVKIPDFTGLDMRQTAELVQRGHLVLVPYGSGRAKKQSLPPGTVAAEGTKLEIWFE
jgi:stage V sporulation protein D (sporulation-specific penicillin-binding protein)